MSTRCRIGYLDYMTNQVYSIYCHFDGYPEYVGAILAENYDNSQKITDLIQLGDISVLGLNTNFRDDTNPNGTRDYHRWRGEDVEIHMDHGISNYEANAFEAGEEYAYLFMGGSWFVSEDGCSWKLLEHFV